MPNTGYRLKGSTTVEVVLPLSPQIGDVVLVTAIGRNGWRLLQNPGQSILTEGWGAGVPGRVWVAHELDCDWREVSSSADGSKLAAVEFGYPLGGGWIYLSDDAGQTWKLRAQQAFWLSVASSADGTKLVAGAYRGSLFRSTNAGLTWAAVAQPGNWTSVAASADGVRWVASDAGTNGGGRIHTSSDCGLTWKPRGNLRDWLSVCSSADGTRLSAVHGMHDHAGNASSGYPHVSSDGGGTWHPTMTDQARRWSSIACSANGQRLVASVYEGGLYTSQDAGVTWQSHLTNEVHRWWRVASSADGQLLVVKGCDGEIFISTNGGESWDVRVLDTPNCGSVTVSTQGNRLVALTGVSTSKRIAVSAPTTTPGASAAVAGDAGSQIELTYAGSNQFRIQRLSGTIRIEGVLGKPKPGEQGTSRR
jgi:hypothetical protein